jgi:hypothetical protein
MDQSQRARFYEGQYLGAEDLAALEEHPRVEEARHALGAHTWGIAVGLDLVERTLPSGEIENVVMPGYAWDGYGRPIVVLAPLKISPLKLVNYQGITPPEGVLVKVWLRYAEQETRNPAPGFAACGVGDQHARIVETYALEVGEPMPGPHDAVTIAGGPVEARAARKAFNAKAPLLFDESVPFQDFPEDPRPRWLLPIGYVRWQKLAGQPGAFAPRVDNPPGDSAKDADVIRQFRQYIGVVAETLHAADGVIRLRDRALDPDPQKTFFHPPRAKEDPANPDDLVWIEGSLRVQGDARLAGGQLEWRNKEGLDGDTPTVLRRTDGGKAPGQTGGRSLEVVIGKVGQEDSRFAVGPLKSDGKLTDRLTVLSTGNVGIDSDTPKATLQLKTLTALDQGELDGRTWSNLGENAHFDGSWQRIDATKAGVNLHMSAQALGTEFRFLRLEADGSRRNIGIIGTETSYIREGRFGVGNIDPVSQVQVKALTAIDEGGSPEGIWSNFGQNAYYDGSWRRVDDKKPGVNLHMNPDGQEQEFRFLKMDKDGNHDNIATLGTGTSYINGDRLGVGTKAPAATLDVNGRVLRKGQDFSKMVTANDGQLVPVPWGSTDDWNIMVSPRHMGADSVFFIVDTSLAMIKCEANEELPFKNGFRITAQFRVTGSDTILSGSANCLLVPR